MSDNTGLSAQRPYRDTPDVSKATGRLIRSVGKRVGREDPDALAELALLQDALDDAWRVAIDGLRTLGFTDRQIGDELGTTKQAVAQRWPR